jgi:hypothetical protein
MRDQDLERDAMRARDQPGERRKKRASKPATKTR